jgi:RHS repeat-associated protein
VLLSYDAENRMVTAGTTTYVYDGDNLRVKTTSGKLYWRGVGSDALVESDLSGTITDEYVFFNGKRIARRNASSGAVTYFFSDHLGSTSVLTNSSGTVIKVSDYYPFGTERPVGGSDPNLYKFTGKERDLETGHTYFGARFYHEGLARFLTPDEFTGGPVDAFSSNDPLPDSPLPYADITNPQSLNKYAYTYNNPLRYTDPDGHIVDTLIDVGAIVYDVSAVVADVITQSDQLDTDVQALGADVVSALVPGLTGGGAAVRLANKADDVVDAGRILRKSEDIKAIVPKRGSAGGPGSGKRASPKQRAEALKENDGRCVFCGKKAEEVDHAIPKSRGGDTTKKNLQPTCRKCNRQKYTKTTKEFLESRKKSDKKKKNPRNRGDSQ